MNVFHFQCNGFSGSIEGTNGRIYQHTDNDQPIAESCTVEVVEDDTLKKWKKLIKKEDLDGLVLVDIPDIVSATTKALSDDTSTISITLSEISNGDLSMILSFPSPLRSSIPIEFLLQQQVEISILKQRIDLLTVELRESKQRQQELQENEISVLKQRVDLLTVELRESKKQQEELKKIARVRKFVDCGKHLSISNCGMMVAHKGSTSDGWRSAIVGETMSDGIYYGEFMTLRMNSEYHLQCGVVSSTETNLNTFIYNINGGFCFNAWSGNVSKHGSVRGISTGLPGCEGMSGCIIVGVLLNLEENKIQFFLNGFPSDSCYDINAGKYKFAVSLRYQWNAVKLLSIEKRK